MKNDDDKSTSAKRPTTSWGQVVQMTPIVLTVMATVLAGLSSSEMTQSMYHRSLAAQHQSKAGDQWAFFQAKRIRGTILEGNVTLLRSLGHAEPLDADRLKASVTGTIRLLEGLSLDAATAAKSALVKLDQWFVDAAANQALKCLTSSALPQVEDQHLPDSASYRMLTSAVQTLSRPHSEAELASIVHSVDPAQIDEATQLARQNADAFDHACEPVAKALGQLRAVIAQLSSADRDVRLANPDRADVASPASSVDAVDQTNTIAAIRANLDHLAAVVEAAALDFDARRYRRESSYNRTTAEIYELRVARSGVESDLHRERSRKFFYSMLLSQAGVTVASLALARANRSLFWTVAAFAGLSSLAFSGVTYFAG